MRNNYGMDNYMRFIAVSRYARWLPEENRRENWAETVQRYIDNVVKPKAVSKEVVDELQQAILNLEVMPSMRAMMTAGPAMDRDNTCAYNCSYLPVDHPYAFDEAMFILLCGTGVGFSVERQYVSQLPVVPNNFSSHSPNGSENDNLITVEDSKEGWALSLRRFITSLFNGVIPAVDVSGVRPSGAPLKTFGGRASGPGPLVELFTFIKNTFVNAAGRKLNSLECHDIMCKIGTAVVVGGVRRSAMISLSNLSDDRMRHAKTGAFWENNPQRSLSNNSVSYTEKPDMNTFMREWQSLMESGTGERGIFSRTAAQHKAQWVGRNHNHEFGTNPCSEIILRPYQFCNLSEVVVRATDNLGDIRRKVRLATILGTIQASYTHFPYLREIWKKNTEEEALLGVSLTGILDNESMADYKFNKLPMVLEELKSHAKQVNKEYAKLLGVNPSASITCVKPSGTVSQLVDSASGIHPRYSDYYIRTVRGSNNDPVTKLMKDYGIPNEPDITAPDKTTVFSFPIRAPEGSVKRNDRSAIGQCKLWLTYNNHWCEHKPSVSIYVKEHEWMEVGAWVYKNFDKVSGMSFFPHSDHAYQQAPYQEITKEQYKELASKMPKTINWDKLAKYEKTDTTISSQSYACTADSCEIVDVT